MTTLLLAADQTTIDLTRAIERELLRLARLHEAAAAREAALVPYWAPCPDSVVGHRCAATLLREDAGRLSRG
jgi:hypothetical protein